MEEPRIFSKTVVFFFSLFGSVFFGALLYSTNLQATDKRKFIAPTILFSIFWFPIIAWLLKGFEFPLVKYFIINGLGGLILIKPFWNYHFPNLIQFERRKVWGPSLALALPILVLLTLHWLDYSSTDNKQDQIQNFNAITDSASVHSTFVQTDSIVRFEGFDITLPSYSYYYTVNTDLLRMLNSTIYFEEGTFTLKLLSVNLKENEVLDLDIVQSNVDSLFLTDKVYSFAEHGRTGIYDTYESDTLAASGQFVLFSRGDSGYLLTTDYPRLNLDYGDSISDYIFNKITPSN